MSKIIKLTMCISAIFLAALSFGCGNTPADELGLNVYYISTDGTKLVNLSPEYGDVSQDNALGALIDALQTDPGVIDLRAPAADFTIQSYGLKNGQLVLNFSSEYLTLEPLREIVIRDAIVSTLSQLKSIELVTIYVNDAPLLDSDGLVVGSLTANSFIDDSYQIFDAYQKASIVLYFANEAGDALVKTTRELVYESSVSKERLVVEELIKGSGGIGHSSINPETKILSVTNNDGICYVNLSAEIKTLVDNVRPEIMVYSIVNSLSELANVNKVQILINGETVGNIAGDVTFAPVLERKLELIK